MGLRHLVFIAVTLAAPITGHAADKPEIAAPAAWIKPLAIPSSAAPQDAAALHVLLNDVQISFHGDISRSFSSTAIQVAKPEGLSALGTFALAWKPDSDRVTVHWLRIRRGVKVIDVLNAGQQFTVLRREQNLEFAALDGVLTATMPIAGLEVGDIVESAWTIERTEPLLKGHHDVALDVGTSGNIARFGLAAQWDENDRIMVKTHNLPAPARQTPGGLSVAADQIEPLILPQGAPLRFRIGRMIELSDFSNWASVSAIFAPLFGTARTLAADSPLHTEIARIKAASSDPAIQAGLALKLVEDKVRYLYIGLNDSNLRPAPADETWQRRFGDCKAKTALLLALLDGLGISAEPALVSTRLGDGLDQRLPNVSQFDHVIVRAAIAGRIYWLDGTRLGDRNIADLNVPDFHWALPVDPRNGALERLVVAPRSAPNTVFDVHIDASKGIMAPAAAHVEARFVGDAGIFMHTALASVSKGALDQQMRGYWSQQYDFIVPHKVTETWDDDTRTERLTMDGSARMAWNDAGSGRRRYELDGAQVGWHADFRRQPGPDSDAPFSLGYPEFIEHRETVVLPNGGDGFSLTGSDVEQTLAHTIIHRHTTLAGDRVTMVAFQQPLSAELSYAEAQQANDRLRELADGSVDIMIDDTRYNVTSDDAKAMLAAPTDSGEDGYRAHLNAYLVLGDAKAGLAEAGHYVAAFPQSAEAFAARATFEAASGMDQAATADAARALVLAPGNPRAKSVTAYYHDLANRADEQGARPAYLAWLRWGQAEQCRRQKEYHCAIRNAEAALAMQPDGSMIYVTLANTYKLQGHNDAAAAVADRMVATAPKNADMQAVAGVIYCSTGQCAKGLKAFSTSLAIRPNFVAYSNHLRYLPRSDLAGRKHDIDGALKLYPANVDMQRALADWQGDSGDHAAQIATLQALAASAEAKGEANMALTVDLAAAYAATGQTDKAREGFAEARGYAIALKNGRDFNNLCYTAAKINFDLETALADCKRAIALTPNSAAVLDSVGFVQLRLGHFADAVAAYNQALAANPTEKHSLYGRGLAYLRQGDHAKGQADIAAAVKLDANIPDEFHAMGVQP